MKKYLVNSFWCNSNLCVFFLAVLVSLGTSFKSFACTPMAIPTLTAQSISGGSLQLTWIGNSAWACTYKIEVEIACNGVSFTGLAPFFNSSSISKPNTLPMTYPVQAINLATLCPGTVYQFRARENNISGSTPSGWTPTYTFVTPGAFVLPVIQSMPDATICPTNTTQLTAQLQNACGPGPLSYSWAPSAGLSCISCSNPIASPSVQTTYTVFVNGGPLSCWTATNAVTVYTSSGNAQVIATTTQVSCTNSVSAVSLTTAGSASVPISITWSPTPGSVSGNSLNATNLPTGITTVAVVDQVGCVKTITLNILPTPPPVTFTVNNLTGSNSITCTNPTINLQAVSNYTYGSLSYSWTSISYTAGTPAVAIDAPNTITVTVTDPATGCYTTEIVTIGINTLVPTNSVNPTSQIITCNSSSPVTFSGTVSDPTVNIQHDWYSPLNPLPGGVPISTSNNTISILSGNIPPGVYTLQTTNLVNGCRAQKTVTVTSLSAFPTFSIGSSTNFSIGCAPLNQTTISILNPVSTQTPSPATTSYTFLAPSFTGVVTPSIVLGSNTSTSTTIPGSWTVIVQDNSNFCRTELVVPIIQNTVAPNVSASMITKTLTCYNPTILATGTSTTANSIVGWVRPVNPPNVSTPTLILGPPNGPNTSSTALTYANYTVVAQNSVNACESTSIIIINQNFRRPISNPTISVGTPSAIYCSVMNNPAVLTTGQSTTTSGGGPTAYVSNPCWEGPSPQTPTCGPSTYSCFVAGIYTLTVTDNYNGCSNSGTVNVLDRTQPPVISEPIATSKLDCGSSSALLNFALTGTVVGGVRYLITDYPHDAAFSPSNVIVYNIDPVLSGTSSQSVTASQPGTYYYTVSNTLTGCQSTGTYVVENGTMTANFEPQPTSGYAPLDVQFTNLSSSSLGTSSIISIWSFGNGAVQTNSTNASTATTFTAPGNYTVMLLASKGACIDTIYKVIKVDMPSKLEVPNIFTPNGDGSNDVFFVQASNLTEIYAIIHDRWGNKVYEVTSNTGNIGWDGKNFQGKECAQGVYFYIITAQGRDGKEYSAKGNVSLYR